MLLENIENALFCAVGGREQFFSEFPILLRKAISDIIDTPNTGRTLLAETEKTEKTHLGTKVEIALRSFTKFPKGAILDMLIDINDVDTKMTIGKNWMIPPEAIGHPCILVSYDEPKLTYSIGVFLADLANLNNGQNRDKKRTISKNGKMTIRWIAKDASI